MNRSDQLPEAVLKRKAVVYVRQSTAAQVEDNLESQRRQYALSDVARVHGFRDVEIIDDDLGLSASGSVSRPGFERLVAQLCAGEIGAVLCLEASRLARNGRDWHHLLELCGLVEARVIDADGIYDPCLPNDRLLLGMKGTISEFELGIIRARMSEAVRAKARRGELRIAVPLGFVWARDGDLALDPDLRVQGVIHTVFERFRQLGSARKVFLWMRGEGLHFPRPSDGHSLVAFEWRVVRYRNVIAALKNPFYAGAYAYGKSEKRITVVDGRAQTTYKHAKPIEQWDVLIKEHHQGYIDWEEYERNQRQLAHNAFSKAGGVKSGRGGRALLGGLLSCARCGRRLKVAYTGRNAAPKYRCEKPDHVREEHRCMAFSGTRVDEAIGAEIRRALQPLAIEAALEAECMRHEQQAEARRLLELELEQTRYEASLAERRYAACDPDNRLIAVELEKSWESALGRVRACEARVASHQYAYYRCIGTDAYRFGGQKICDNTQVRTQTLDELVWAEVINALENPARLKSEYERRLGVLEKSENDRHDTTVLNKQKAQLKKGASRLIDSYANDVIDQQDFEPKIKQIKARIVQIDEQIEQGNQSQSAQRELFLVINHLEEFAKTINVKLSTTNFITKRDTIRALVKRVEIYKDEVVVVFRIDPAPSHSTDRGTTTKSDNGDHFMDSCKGRMKSSGTKTYAKECRFPASLAKNENVQPQG